MFPNFRGLPSDLQDTLADEFLDNAANLMQSEQVRTKAGFAAAGGPTAPREPPMMEVDPGLAGGQQAASASIPLPAPPSQQIISNAQPPANAAGPAMISLGGRLYQPFGHPAQDSNQFNNTNHQQWNEQALPQTQPPLLSAPPPMQLSQPLMQQLAQPLMQPPIQPPMQQPAHQYIQPQGAQMYQNWAAQPPFHFPTQSQQQGGWSEVHIPNHPPAAAANLKLMRSCLTNLSHLSDADMLNTPSPALPCPPSPALEPLIQCLGRLSSFIKVGIS